LELSGIEATKVEATGIERDDDGACPVASAIDLDPDRRHQVAVSRVIAGIDWLVGLT